MKDITEFQRSNLKKLIKVMLNIKKYDYKLSMETFHNHYDRDYSQNRIPKPNEISECGSTCCMIGYGRVYGVGDQASIKLPPNDYSFLNFVDGYLNYIDFIKDLDVNLDPMDAGNLTIWSFMFGTEWKNDIDEGIARINLVLEGRYKDIKLCSESYIIEEKKRTYYDYDYDFDYNKV
jgi:hypothetical protein